MGAQRQEALYHLWWRSFDGTAMACLCGIKLAALDAAADLEVCEAIGCFRALWYECPVATVLNEDGVLVHALEECYLGRRGEYVPRPARTRHEDEGSYVLADDQGEDVGQYQVTAAGVVRVVV